MTRDTDTDTDTDSPDDLPTNEELAARLAGEGQPIHRRREWADGDTLYGVAQFIADHTGVARAKTYREGDTLDGRDAEAVARERFAGGFYRSESGDTVLYRATVRNPYTEPPNPEQGDVPERYATLTDVEIVERSPPGDDSAPDTTGGGAW